jgi:acetoin utilization deacetylase AcuC-like enzyme
MNINFKKLGTREDWEAALAEIIDAARTAVTAKDEDAISEAIDLLNKFIDVSPPAQAWSTGLDDHAREALGELALDVVTATNEDLASRTEELRRIAKAVAATAANNEQAAAGIRHEKLTKALVSVMDAAKAAKELQAAVQDTAGDEKIADAAEALLKTIATFKDVVAKADSGQ